LNKHQNDSTTCGKKLIAHERGKAVSLRLTEEDVFSRHPDKAAIKQIGSMKRYLRKKSERFHRACLRTKKRAIVKRAKRRGWKPIDDVRHHGDNQG
jgi:hypothetical protein